jgi:transcription initiation factor TFIIE subunit alpha
VSKSVSKEIKEEADFMDDFSENNGQLNNSMSEELKSHIKLENELLNNPLVSDYLISNFGENSIKIILAAMDETTDDAIAARCKLKVAEVRAILNKLYNYRLAEYKRIKDRDTGWFSYIWKIDVSNVLSIIEEQVVQKIKELDRKVEKINTELVYYCPKCSKTNLISFDLASELYFRCPNCENRLVEKDIKEKEELNYELTELKEKHQLLVDQIAKFEEMKRAEEQRLKELQARQFAEAAVIQELEKERKRMKKMKRQKERAKQMKKNSKKGISKKGILRKNINALSKNSKSSKNLKMHAEHKSFHKNKKNKPNKSEKFTRAAKQKQNAKKNKIKTKTFKSK